MNEIAFLIAYTVVSTVFAALGVVLLVSPSAFSRLLGRCTTALGWDATTAQRVPRDWREARIAGLILALLGFAFLGFPLYWLFSTPGVGQPTSPQIPNAPTGSNWDSIVIASGIVVLGLLLLLRPRILANWVTRVPTVQRPPQDVPHSLLVVFRLLGAILAGFGIINLYSHL